MSDDGRAPTVSTTRLLTRGEAARVLGISKSSLRRREGNLLHPVKGPRGVHLFDETELRAVVVRHSRGVRADPGIDGEIAAEVFDRLDRGIHPVDIVKEIRLEPSRVEQLQSQWARMRDGFVVTSEERQELESLPLNGAFPIASAATLVANIRESLGQNCADCEERAAAICLRCARARVGRSVERAAQLQRCGDEEDEDCAEDSCAADADDEDEHDDEQEDEEDEDEALPR